MKCEFCGGDLSLETEYCPHCGQINKHAQQHIRDMKRYHGEFESTKRGVYSATKKYSEVTAKVIIIAGLVVVIAIMLFVYDNAYSFRREIAQSNARRNVKKYSVILDRYLADEDFEGFQEFCTLNYIDGFFDDGAYEEYIPLIGATRNYMYLREYLMCMVAATDQEGRDRYIEEVCNYLSYFYQYTDLERYSYYENADREENVKALAAMENNIRLMLCAYCNLTEEEALSLKGLSDAKRIVLIEERMENDQ